MERGIFVERAMNSRLIIIGGILAKDPAQVRLPKDDHVLGFEPVANMPEEFAARIEAEIPKWGKVIRDAISKPSRDWVS
jgi:hypothetical protein